MLGLSQNAGGCEAAQNATQEKSIGLQDSKLTKYMSKMMCVAHTALQQPNLASRDPSQGK
jgi:hypothetical protein